MAKPPTKSTNIRDLSASRDADRALHRPSARGSEDDRRGDDRAGTRGRGCIDDFRLLGRRHPAYLRRRVLLQRGPREEGRAADAAHRAGERAGRGFHGRGLCARQRPRGRGHRHLGSRRHQHGHADPRLHGGFHSDRRHLRAGARPAPSAPMRSRKRRCPPSWARSPNTSSWSPIRTSSKPRCAPRSKSRAPAVPGPVVIDVPKDVQNWSGEFKGTGTLPMPGYRKRLETLTTDIIDGTEANHFFEMLGESQRPLIYAGGGVINGNASRGAARVRRRHSTSRWSPRSWASAPWTPPALSHAHAGHARRRRSPTTRSMIAIS